MSDLNKVKVGDKVLKTSGHTYDRTLNLRVGTVVKLTKTQIKVEFRRRDDTYTENFRLSNGHKVGASPYYTCHIEPFTDEAYERFLAWRDRLRAERRVRDGAEKIEKVYRDNIRDDRTNAVISTENLVEAAELIDKTLKLLNYKEEESNA